MIWRASLLDEQAAHELVLARRSNEWVSNSNKYLKNAGEEPLQLAAASRKVSWVLPAPTPL